jgi:hypothetical protein
LRARPGRPRSPACIRLHPGGTDSTASAASRAQGALRASVPASMRVPGYLRGRAVRVLRRSAPDCCPIGAGFGSLSHARGPAEIAAPLSPRTLRRWTSAAEFDSRDGVVLTLDYAL